MNRRAFITLLGGAAAWPLAARAQQPATPVIGFLHQEAAKTAAQNAEAFRNGLAEAGYVEGQNAKIEYRWAEGHYDRLPELAADLVSRNVAVIAAAFLLSVQAAESVTSTIPICFIIGVDPVKLGLVASLNRPGGNVTGTAILSVLIGAKRLGLLHDLLPAVKTIALLVNSTSRVVAEEQSADLQSAARDLGQRIVLFNASTEHEIEMAFAAMIEQQVGALIVAPDGFFHGRADQIVALAARHAIPTFYDRREVVVAGGLMSYGVIIADTFRQQGVYVGRILKGERPADLPVIQPTKFDFVINLKTAKALGLTFPSGLLAIADEVID
jgi:putative tryptophan/tyrosine transport system substrate-binding protein